MAELPVASLARLELVVEVALSVAEDVTDSRVLGATCTALMNALAWMNNIVRLAELDQGHGLRWYFDTTGDAAAYEMDHFHEAAPCAYRCCRGFVAWVPL